MQWVMKALSWLGAVVAGAIFGVAGTICYASAVLKPGGGLIVIPLGLMLAAVACLSLLLAIRLLADDRGAVLGAGLGMLIALFVFSSRGPGGSVVVPQVAEGEAPLGIIWAWTLAIVVLVVVAWPDLRRGRAAHAEQVEAAAPDDPR
ncbi:histidinol dehydrogenase [Microbacterium halotolerans]|uniref:histidinol dehydrogenase n=1 Tax=Microbacterium halotolerans TaxID=246613 RepID=UPI001969287F|nr:histidinol dehydrogenase [Microbacterium halotolerans]